MSSSRRTAEEEHRTSVERSLRPEGAGEADRDHGLEEAWRRHLAGRALEGDDGHLHLAAEGTYRARFPDGMEHGAWGITSCVGRASLMLTPDGGTPYGYILTREGGAVALNGRVHACRDR